MNRTVVSKLTPAPIRRAVRDSRLKNSHYFPAEPHNPTTLLLYITQNCNLRCGHCNYLLEDPDYFSPKTDITFELLGQILKGHETHFNNIILSAEGEPTSHKAFVEVLRTCAQATTKLSMVTNGTTKLDTLKEIVRNVDALTISLDGVDADTFKAKRGGSEKTFEHVVSIIRQAKELQETMPDARLKSVTVNSIIEREILPLMEPLIRYCAELGVNSSLGNFVPIGGGAGRSPLMESDPAVIDEYRRITSITDWGTKVALPRLVNPGVNNHCNFLFTRLPTNYNGNLSPCCYMGSNPRYGNFQDSDEPWNSEGLESFRRQFSTAKRLEDLPSLCRSCHSRTKTRIRFNHRTKKWSNLGYLDAIEQRQGTSLAEVQG